VAAAYDGGGGGGGAESMNFLFETNKVKPAFGEFRDPNQLKSFKLNQKIN